MAVGFRVLTPIYAVSFAPRRSTVTAYVGAVPVGSAHPIVVQSMTNTDTADAAGTAVQVAALAAAGSQLVRITVNNDEAAAAVPEIVARLSALGVNVPIVGDFHYNGRGKVCGSNWRIVKRSNTAWCLQVTKIVA